VKDLLIKRFNQAKKEIPEWILDDFQIYGNKEDLQYIETLALETHIVLKKSPSNFTHGLLLFMEASAYSKKFQAKEHIFALDVGSARGFSALVMAYAFQKHELNPTIISVDVINHFEKKKWNCILDKPGGISRAEIIGRYPEGKSILFLQGKSSKVLAGLGTARIHFSFLDGEHEWKSLKVETEFLQRNQISGDVVIFDDYSPTVYPGVVRAVSEISMSYQVKIRGEDRGRAYAVASKI
jgi:hypothetical protein